MFVSPFSWANEYDVTAKPAADVLRPTRKSRLEYFIYAPAMRGILVGSHSRVALMKLSRRSDLATA